MIVNFRFLCRVRIFVSRNAEFLRNIVFNIRLKTMSLIQLNTSNMNNVYTLSKFINFVKLKILFILHSLASK